MLASDSVASCGYQYITEKSQCYQRAWVGFGFQKPMPETSQDQDLTRIDDQRPAGWLSMLVHSKQPACWHFFGPQGRLTSTQRVCAGVFVSRFQTFEKTRLMILNDGISCEAPHDRNLWSNMMIEMLQTWSGKSQNLSEIDCFRDSTETIL